VNPGRLVAGAAVETWFDLPVYVDWVAVGVVSRGCGNFWHDSSYFAHTALAINQMMITANTKICRFIGPSLD
jgi:hypothetical protein